MIVEKIIEPKELNKNERINSFDEVVQNYTEEEALKEAARCLQCKNPTCIKGCPVNIDIKKFIFELTQKDYQAAYKTLKDKNDFPSICGRVCPAEYQCRKVCVLTPKDANCSSEKAINIGFLERFVGDKASSFNGAMRSEQKKFENKKVAVVGSGPAGICTAGELAKAGVSVVMFESLHKTGGVLRYGIPLFRLPRNILDYEIDNLKTLGVEIKTNFIIGKNLSIEELFAEGYSFIFLGLGAGEPSFLGVEGENLCNVYSANEFLTRINLMQAYKFPQYHTPINIGRKVVVIGGGNTAMDAARCAVRLQKLNGLELNVTVIYRRSEEYMPARQLELHHAKEEGVRFKFLLQPKKINGNESGYVKSLDFYKCELSENKVNGRKKAVVIEGSNESVRSDLVIMAVGLKPNRLLTSVTDNLEIDKNFDVVVNPETMETSIKNVFAGGDIVGGEGTVIEAMGMGKIAAQTILAKIITP
ncbi:NADPH-dependent glutamate synthase [bacterium]